MAQTFTDLCRERTDANRGLHAFALGTFAETSAQIMRENMTQLMETNNVIRWGRWVLVTAAVLAVPALAMAFNIGVPDPGQGTEGVNWGPMDFATMGVLILGSGLLFEYASSRGGSVAHRAAVGIAVLAGLGLIWVNLAVGMMDVENGEPDVRPRPLRRARRRRDRPLRAARGVDRDVRHRGRARGRRRDRAHREPGPDAPGRRVLHRWRGSHRACCSGRPAWNRRLRGEPPAHWGPVSCQS